MKNIFFLLITALLFSCSKEDAETIIPPEEPPVTPNGTVEESTIERTIRFKTAKEESGHSVLTITERMQGDAAAVNKTETYSYNNNNQLIQHSTLQEYYPQLSTSYERNLEYTGNTVIVNDTYGNVLTYTLNSDGYATSCKYQEGSLIFFYNFQYSDDKYLTSIQESISNNLLSRTDLLYKNGDLTSVTTFSNDIENTLLYEPGETMNVDKFPCIVLSETSPLSKHTEALYGGLLGKATEHHVMKIQPKGNNDEWTDFRYSVNESGNVTSVRMTTHYKGIVIP